MPEELKEYVEAQTRLGYSTPSEDVRELIYGKRQSAYWILFVVREDVVIILAVWRASRGPAEL